MSLSTGDVDTYKQLLKKWFDLNEKLINWMIKKCEKLIEEDDLIQHLWEIFNLFDDMNSATLSMYLFGKHQASDWKEIPYSAKMWKKMRTLIRRVEEEREKLIEKDHPLLHTSIIHAWVGAMIKSWKDVIHMIDDEDVDTINSLLKTKKQKQKFDAKDLLKINRTWQLTDTKSNTQQVEQTTESSSPTEVQ